MDRVKIDLMDIDLKEILVAGVSHDTGLIVEESLPKASEEQVISFEKTIGFKLPADYREFLLTLNGGAPNLNKMEGLEYKVKPVTDDPRALSGINLLDYLYSLGDAQSELLGVSLPVLTLEDRYASFIGLNSSDTPFIPEDCIPIGTPLGSQSMLLLCLGGEFEDHVLDYEYRRDPTEKNGNVSIAGSNFTEFVNAWSIMSY